MKYQIGEPFGEPDCESEVETLQKEYHHLYFGGTPFNSAALEHTTYLIIGRRGSGKTALAQYFSFQDTLPNPIYIGIAKPKQYQKVLSDVAARASESREIALPHLEDVWKYTLWRVIFDRTRTYSPAIAKACGENHSGGAVSNLVDSIFDRLLKLFGASNEKPIDKFIEYLWNEEQFDAAQLAVLKVASRRPIIIAFDTLERHDVTNDGLMNAMAALVQFAAKFNVKFRSQGIHLKVLMSGEVFPYLEEEVLQNPTKSIKKPVYLFWRPKDLLRLISWRFYHYLQAHDLLLDDSKGEIEWASHKEVLNKMWIPYFGSQLVNARGVTEPTFYYLLRHTQMRPRQLIVICNSIAERARRAGRFPRFSEEDIKLGVRGVETRLATEIINSFDLLYPQVGRIVDALTSIHMLFRGNELYRRAKASASAWPPGTYEQEKFRQLVAELGIVGRVLRHDEPSGHIAAEFQYTLEGRLPITQDQECVIHPMFYSRFKVNFNSKSRVIPSWTAETGPTDDDDL